jgi:ParB family chromosome partitioning protein
MAKRPVLGRGLAALLGEAAEDAAVLDAGRSGGQPVLDTEQSGSSTEEGPAGGSGVVDLPVTAIRRNPRQPRRVIDAEALDELAGSIREVGIVQPIIVRPVGDAYELIAGERRWRAAQKAGYTVVPAIVRQASDVESLELALVENVVRQQLNPIDEAFALKVLLEDLGVTQENLAARVGKSRSAIANKIRLLDLPAPIQESLSIGTISEGHGRALLGLTGQGRQLQLARRIVEKGLSVRQVEDQVRRSTRDVATSSSTQHPVPPPMEVETLDALRESLFTLLGVMPRIRTRGKGGVIELPFKDTSELRQIEKRLRS